MIEIRAVTTDEEYEVYAATQRRIFPGAPSLDEFRHRERTWAAFHAIAYLDGAPAGTGFAGVFPGAEAEPDLSCGFGTVPELRGRGVGTERQEALVLELAEHDPRAVEPPTGVEIVTRAERPDLNRQLYEVGVGAARDIPGLDGTLDPAYEAWASFELERPSRDPELCFIALADGRVVGFASLDVFPSGRVFRGLTAVMREWRSRGVGAALKRAQIAAAKERGFERLRTESQHENEPMRRLNEKLGFRPDPSWSTIVLRGRLAE